MTLRQLEVFLAVAREKNFSRATKKIRSTRRSEGSPRRPQHLADRNNGVAIFS
jgi:hypothetical protein